MRTFAREVMELFTLGEGHYTEQDIQQAAKAYTGWGLSPDQLRITNTISREITIPARRPCLRPDGLLTPARMC